MLDAVASELGCSERTLRRYIAGGLLRGRRVGRGQLELSMEEQSYLRGHWDLLHGLMSLLRTEPEVRMAVLFGSAATGTDTPASDVDLLVVQRSSGWGAQAALTRRLRRGLGRTVDVISLEQAHAQPSLLLDVLRDGRVLADRDERWMNLQLGVDRVQRAALREERLAAAAAHTAIAAARERLATA